MWTPAVIGLVVTLTVTLAGVVFQAGRLSARVDHLEKTVDRFQETLEGFFRRLEHMTPRRPSVE